MHLEQELRDVLGFFILSQHLLITIKTEIIEGSRYLEYQNTKSRSWTVASAVLLAFE